MTYFMSFGRKTLTQSISQNSSSLSHTVEITVSYFDAGVKCKLISE